LFDLELDPGELRNLWAASEVQTVKAELLLRLAQTEMENQPLPMPRVSIA
jgi:uncharacterized sulfatase